MALLFAGLAAAQQGVFPPPNSLAGAGTVFYGAYSSLPSTCTQGVFFPTSGILDRAICTATNTWTWYYANRPITPAAQLGITNLLGSALTVTNSQGFESISAPNAGVYNPVPNLRAWAAPAAPYTAYIAIIAPPLFPYDSNYATWQVGWADSSGKSIALNCGTGSGGAVGFWCDVREQDATGAYVSRIVNITAPVTSYRGRLWVRLSDDGTNNDIQMCTDPSVCYDLTGSFSRTTYLSSPSKFVYGASTGDNNNLQFTLVGQQ